MTTESLVYKEAPPRQAQGSLARAGGIGLLRAEGQHIAAAAIEKSYRKGQHQDPRPARRQYRRAEG